ncbi:hypothetical protein ACK8GE_17420 [Micromonosporaceae bacterium DT194]|uniref:hypothetical protein n=1 Tax=Melissospora conviva TaxID=3388432 RepID=UPI003C13D368
MSHGGESFAMRGEAAGRPMFEQARRGYEKVQVDRYIDDLHAASAQLRSERDQAQHQLRRHAQQFEQLQAELASLRERPAQVDRASFRDLGPLVEQILALAEKQAGLITEAAEQRAEELRHEAELIRTEAREHSAAVLQDLEEELAARRAEQDKLYEERRAAAEAQLADIQELVTQLRGEGEAAYAHAQQEATRISELTAQQAEEARAAAEAFTKAARTQIQQEIQAARAQSQQELAQLRVNVEREINERRANAEQELAEHRATAEREVAAQLTAAEEKIGTLIGEAQQYSTEVRKRADEQAALHQEQLEAVQQEVERQRQALMQLNSELDAGRQQLAEIQQEGAAAENEYTRLQRQVTEIRRDLTAETNRLAEARRAADSVEQHAKDVRARVQREAKRVADLAAAAVMAAAAGGGSETAEYPTVPQQRPEPTPMPAEPAGEQPTGEMAIA